MIYFFEYLTERMIITNDVVEATCLCASVMHLILSQTI
jgi:hypothetical protein